MSGNEMNCLSGEEIYLFLEEEISPSERIKIKEHLLTCDKCKEALEERRMFLEALKDIPLWETPPDFTIKTVERLFSRKNLFAKGIWLAVAGSVSIFIFLTLILNPVKYLSEILQNFTNLILNFTKGILVFLAKIIKMIIILSRTLFLIVNIIIKGFSKITTLITPEIQMMSAGVILIIISFFIYLMMKKVSRGERI